MVTDFSFSGRQASNLDEAGRGEWRRLSWIGNEGNGARKAVLQLADRVYQGPNGDQVVCFARRSANRTGAISSEAVQSSGMADFATDFSQPFRGPTVRCLEALGHIQPQTIPSRPYFPGAFI